MTIHLLFLAIGAVLLAQVALAVGVAVWRRPAGLAAAARTDLASATARAWAGWRQFLVTRREFEDVARSQCSFYLSPADKEPLPPFAPGQYLTFRIGIASDGESSPAQTVTRCYSLSDSPDPARYRITVKRALAPGARPELPAGLASACLHDHVQVGDTLLVQAPAGRFVLDADPTLPSVLVGGGIGITPLLSMVRACAGEQPGRQLHLFYGVRDGRDHAFKAVLEELAASHPNLHLEVVYGSPAAGDVAGRDFQHAGLLTLDLLQRTLPAGRHRYYVCGPPPMMDSLLPALLRSGVAPEDLHKEAFGAAAAPPAIAKGAAVAAGAVGFDIVFQRSGRTVRWEGRETNLLDFAEGHGVEVASGCRAGSCGSCQTRVLGGAVHYRDRPDHELTPGYCLLCVAEPDAALVLDA